MGFLRTLGLTFILPTAAVAVAVSAVKIHDTHPNLCSGMIPCRNTNLNYEKTNPTTSLRPFPTVAFCSSISMASEMKTSPKSQGDIPPDVMTEFMVDMKCGGCASTVKNKLEILDGVKRVDVHLSNQVVRVLGSTSTKAMTQALEETGMKSRLIGQGSPEEFLVSAAVAEFKGPQIFGVVRFAQVTMELCRVDASFSGLSAGSHSWSINEFGDLTRGAASTGNVYNPSTNSLAEPLGHLGSLHVDESGEATFSGGKPMLKVGDLIGRAVVLYDGEDQSKSRISAAVIARSAGVGENYKKICSCDGTVIWEATNSDFVKG